MSFNYLPNADAAFLAWTANFANLLDTEGPTVGMTAAQIAAYVAKQAAYAAIYAIADQPTTRTRPATSGSQHRQGRAGDDDARLGAHHAGVTGDDRHAPPLVPDQCPSSDRRFQCRPRGATVRTVSAVQRTIVADIFDAASATKRGRAPLTAGAKVYTFVGASYPSDPTLWSYQGDYTKARVEIEMPASVPGGSQVWIMAAWYNSKGETGPIAEPVSINIPGFGASELASPAMKIAA